MGLILPRLAPLQVYLGLSRAPHCSFVMVSFEDPASACGMFPDWQRAVAPWRTPDCQNSLLKLATKSRKRGLKPQQGAVAGGAAAGEDRPSRLGSFQLS